MVHRTFTTKCSISSPPVTGPLLDIAATGRSFTYTGAAFFTIADRLITDIWVLGDLDELRRQLSAPQAHGQGS
jgi:predicted ester cyclase